MKNKKLTAGLLAILMAATMTACNNTQTTTQNDVTSQGNVTTSAEATTSENALTDGDATTNSDATTAGEATTAGDVAGETVYPVTVTDSDGRTVEIKEEPEKVISMAPNVTEMMYSLGVEDKLIGRTDYCDYPVEVEQVESVGTINPANVELIISKEPDLVIASTHFTEEDEKALQEAGIPILVEYEEKNVEGVYTMLETMGTALNAQEQAAATVDSMKERIENVTEAVKDAQPVSVYYVVGYGEYGDYTAGGDTFINGILTLAGGDNIAKDVSGWSYSTESLIEADPEVIIVPEASYDDFIKTSPYSDLTAVKEGKVYKIDNNMLDRQCARNADAIEEIAKDLHPDKFN